jgi:DnaJ-class molecular chaperone
MPSSPVKSGKKGRDFYAMLGVDKTANQGSIL